MKFKLWSKVGMGGVWSECVEVSHKSAEQAVEALCVQRKAGKPNRYTNDTYRATITVQGRVYYLYIKAERIRASG